MRETFYVFKSPEGVVETMTIKQALARPEKWVKDRLEVLGCNLRNPRRKDDGFKPGFQENINEYVGGRLEYNKRLKELGLQEVGYDYTPQDSSAKEYHALSNPEVVQELAKMDLGLTDQHLDAISTGEFFKDDSIPAT
jgi:hypothetical protein